MAIRYWVGGSATWTSSNTTSWSASSGGAGGASFPTSADTVVFDNNSNVGTGAFTVTLGGGTINCLDVTFGSGASALDGAMILAFGNNNLNVYGSWTNPATNFSTTSTGGTLQFQSTTTGKTITTAGVAHAEPFAFIGVGGGWKLQDALTITSTSNVAIDLQAGTFDTNNFNVTCASFQSAATGVRTLTLGSTTITLNGTTIAAWNASGSNFTLNAGTSTIIYSDTTVVHTFAGNGLTYNNLVIGGTTSTSKFNITGANTFNTLSSTRTVAWTLSLPSSVTTTVSNFNISGTVGNVVSLTSSTGGTQATLSKASGTVTVSYMSIRDSNATGGAVWRAPTNLGNTNTSNNTGWNFTAISTGNFFQFFI